MSCVTSHMSCVTFHMSHVTSHMSHVTYHMSRVTCHVSHDTCHMSHVMCHLSPIICHLSLTPTATATNPPPSNSPIIQRRLGCTNQKTLNMSRRKKSLEEEKNPAYARQRISRPMQIVRAFSYFFLFFLLNTY